MDQIKIGKFLKECRVNKNITQEKLADILGVSNRSVSRWESGVNMPDLEILIELAKYYDVEVMEILEGEKKKTKDNITTDELLLKVTDYNNIEKDFFSKRMCIMFILALICLIVFTAIDFLELSKIQPYETIASVALGMVLGTIITGLLYSSRYILKLKSLKNKLRGKYK